MTESMLNGFLAMGRDDSDLVSIKATSEVQLQWTKRYVPVHKMLYSEFQALWGAQLYRANEDWEDANKQLQEADRELRAEAWKSVKEKLELTGRLGALRKRIRSLSIFIRHLNFIVDALQNRRKEFEVSFKQLSFIQPQPPAEPNDVVNSSNSNKRTAEDPAVPGEQVVASLPKKRLRRKQHQQQAAGAAEQVALSEDKSPELPNLCGGEDCSSQLFTIRIRRLYDQDTQDFRMCTGCSFTKAILPALEPHELDFDDLKNMDFYCSELKGVEPARLPLACLADYENLSPDGLTELELIWAPKYGPAINVAMLEDEKLYTSPLQQMSSEDWAVVCKIKRAE